MRNQIDLGFEFQRPGILMMLAIDHETQGLDPLHAVDQGDARHTLDINRFHLFTFLQIFPHIIRLGGLDTKRNATTGTTDIEAKNKTGTFRCATMDVTIDAERPMISVKPRRTPLDELKTGTPHKRPISKHPQILHLDASFKGCSLARP